MVQKDEFKLFSKERIRNPYGIYTKMRREEPICQYMDPQNETSIWYLTRFDDVHDVLKDDKRFVSDRRNVSTEISEKKLVKDKYERVIQNHLATKDPPDHTRLRDLTKKVLTPELADELESFVQETSNQLIDKVESKGKMDLIEDYAIPVPLSVIGKLLGVPATDHNKFRRWTQVYVDPSQSRKFKKQIGEFTSWARKKVAERQAEPQDDLITYLIQARESGEILDEDELLSMMFLMLLAGHDTTTNLIANGTLILLRYPDLWEKLKDDPTLMDTAVEELLRFESPVQGATVRYASEDVNIRGHLIKRGDKVQVMMGAANYDPEQFHLPEELDLSRKPNRHMAFGHGIHFCLGAPFGRMEGRVALNTLIQRIPNLRLAVSEEKLKWNPSIYIRGLSKLPVAWNK
ncbi:MAG: cytochrome P450 [Chloroflexi bacterium]|nr:cytochrome P450 [Chloroflexota bacterium]